MYLPHTIIMAEQFDIPGYLPFVVALCMIPATVLSLTSLMTLGFLYGNLVSSLAVWAAMLSTNAKKKKPDRDLYDGCHKMLTALEAVSRLFSIHLFVVTILDLFGVITIAYRSLSFFIGTYEQDYKIVVMSVGYMGFVLMAITPIAYFGFMEHEVHLRIRGLIQSLVNVNTPEGGIIVEHLKMYKGFPALDFFYVNKSSLSTIFTTFLHL